jgi:hypothetical protein
MTIKSAQAAPANPFQQLITACGNDPVSHVWVTEKPSRLTTSKIRLQDAYESHRKTRNAQFRKRLLNPAFREWQFDEILHNVLKAEKGLIEYSDPRHNLGFWTRPPRHIRELVFDIQREIAAVAGSCRSCLFVL